MAALGTTEEVLQDAKEVKRQQQKRQEPNESPIKTAPPIPLQTRFALPLVVPRWGCQMLNKCCDLEEVCVTGTLTASSCLCIRDVSSLHTQKKILSAAAVGFLPEDGESGSNGMYTDFEYDRESILNRKAVIYKPEIFLKYAVFMGLIHSTVSSHSTTCHGSCFSKTHALLRQFSYLKDHM